MGDRCPHVHRANGPQCILPRGHEGDHLYDAPLRRCVRGADLDPDINVRLAADQTYDILYRSLCTDLAPEGPVKQPVANLRTAANTIAAGLADLGRVNRNHDTVTLHELVILVDQLNKEGLEQTGKGRWSFLYGGHGALAVTWDGIVLWDSDSDERREVGVCESCGGRGSTAEGHPCESCDGDGTGYPLEPVEIYLRRRIRDLAFEISMWGC